MLIIIKFRKGLSIMTANEKLMNALIGTTKEGCDTLVLAADWYGDKGDKTLYALAFDRETLHSVVDALDVYFKPAGNNGIRLTKRGKLSLRKVGRLVKCGFTRADLEPFRLEGENELGHALERYLGEQLDHYNDKVLKRDISMQAYFTNTRKSTRKVQCKLIHTGTTANK